MQLRWCYGSARSYNRVQQQTMELIDSKAFYLKKYNRYHRMTSDPLQFNTRKTNTKSPSQIHRYRPNYQPKNQPKINNIKTTINLLPSSEALKSNTKYTSFIDKKQQQLISKVMANKYLKTKGQRRKSVGLSQNLILRHNGIYQFLSIEQASMKPTTKLFNRLQNIRIAQNLLSAKPSKEVSSEQLCLFYKQQQLYKMNISKLSFKHKAFSKHTNYKHRKEWHD